jgi:hypothetical protein
MESDIRAFQYPPQSLVRRHGPKGYTDYRSFRPWLRDEFSFRCVYCLIREQWGRVTGEFDLDHFVPQNRNPDQTADYDNLFYACRTCNLRKGARQVPDPGATLTDGSVRVYPDGTLVGLTDNAEKVIRVLCLNSPALIRWRRTWIRIIQLVEVHEPELFRDLMRYPDDLPDLKRCRVTENTRPKGIEGSYFARRMRGELPDVYY